MKIHSNTSLYKKIKSFFSGLKTFKNTFLLFNKVFSSPLVQSKLVMNRPPAKGYDFFLFSNDQSAEQ